MRVARGESGCIFWAVIQLRRVCFHSLFVIAAVALLLMPARGQSPWVQASSPTSQDLYGVCCWSGKFVAVGAAGTILTSQDGVHWTAQSSGTAVTLRAVASLWGQFVAVGDQGTILTSPDGAAWTSVNQGGPNLFAAAVALPETFVAVGQDGGALRSSDGMHWSAESLGTSASLHAILDLPGAQMMAVGDAGMEVVLGLGISATAGNIGTADDLYGLALVGFPSASADFVVGSDGYCAFEGSSGWTPVALGVSGNLNAIAQTLGADGGSTAQVVIAADGGTTIIGTSPDTPQDLTWKVVPSGVTADLLGVCSNQIIVVVVGRGGTILAAPQGLGPPIISSLPFEPLPPVPVGSSTSFNVPTLPSGPLSYQWTFNGQIIPGQTAATLTLSDVQLNQAGSYTATINNGYATTSETFQMPVAFIGTMPGLIDTSFQPPNSAYESPIVPLPSGDVLDGETWLYANGAVNSTFAPSFGPSHYLVQGDGKVVAEGLGVLQALSQRFNSDGSLDSTWSPDQAINPQTGTLADDAEPSFVLPSGGFLSVSSTGVVVRLAANGQRDASYTPLQESSTGLQPTTFVGDFELLNYATYSAVDSSAGWVWTVMPGGQNIYRFLSDGTPDPSFSVATAGVTLQGVHAQNRQLQFFGYSGDGTTFSAVRLNGDGSADTSYGPVSLPDAWVKCAAYGTDGSLYVDFSEGIPPMDPMLPIWFPGEQDDFNLPWSAAGAPYPAWPFFDGTYREGIVRFDSDGNFDPTFSLNLDGIWPPTGATADTNMSWMGFAPNGQLYVQGDFGAIQGFAAPGLARLNLSAATQTAILANLSARGEAGPGAAALIGGFVIGNGGSKSILLRGVGPTLSSFGVADALPDPQLTLFGPGGQAMLTAQDWSQSSRAYAVAAEARVIGAFALPSGSADAAVLLTMSSGSDTFAVSGASGDSGTALIEVYDADTPPLTVASPQLVNVAARGTVSAGNPLVGGFIVAQGNTKRVLVRAIGPALAQFGVANVLPDPVLSLYSGQELIATEQGWSTWQSLLQPTFGAVGAFSLPANSLDSALVLTLPPGGYSAQVTSASGASGEAMIEIYAVP